MFLNNINQLGRELCPCRTDGFLGRKEYAAIPDNKFTTKL